MDRYGTGPRSFGATFWIPGVKTEKTAKKRRKKRPKRARYSHLKRVRVADLLLMDRYNLRVQQPWYNLVFGVGAASVGPSGGADTLKLDFDRGGHQSSQGAKTLDNIWLEGDLAL